MKRTIVDRADTDYRCRLFGYQNISISLLPLWKVQAYICVFVNSDFDSKCSVQHQSLVNNTNVSLRLYRVVSFGWVFHICPSQLLVSTLRHMKQILALGVRWLRGETFLQAKNSTSRRWDSSPGPCSQHGNCTLKYAKPLYHLSGVHVKLTTNKTNLEIKAFLRRRFYFWLLSLVYFYANLLQTAPKFFRFTILKPNVKKSIFQQSHILYFSFSYEVVAKFQSLACRKSIRFLRNVCTIVCY